MAGKMQLKLWNALNDIDASSITAENIRAWIYEFLHLFLSALMAHALTVKRWFVSKPIGRRQRRKVSVLTVYFLIQLVFYVKLNVDTHNTHELDSAQTPVFPCERTPEEAKALRELFYDVREVLNELEIHHFLMYGSIWGAYRSKGPLPWDYDIDLGVLGDEAFSKIPREKFVRAFQERGIRVNDKMHQASVFYLIRGKFAQVDLDVFFDYNGWMQRTGWVPWVLYYNYKSYHTFPAWMVQEPMPTMQFFDVQMPVPHGGKEILKYLYPKDWETPFTPAACQGNDITLNTQTEPTEIDR
ncbi:Hypothetical predicted protein [Paramuricea clavata]|uniref:LicD/FKTN/FKRP nucleotidyltransferase domain-containing protein n=1 Tax=Paramuricea clavata TaxID=317549 RepID=A0A6S7L2R8_PARCT|nr:Hypothetical predicted protein [Paramuricea clavata]